MKRFITGLLALALALYSPAWAATRMQMTGFGVVASGGGGNVPTLIPTNQGSATSGATTGTTLALTLPASVVSGAMCIAHLSFAGNHAGISGQAVDDDKGNAYTAVDVLFNAPGGFSVANFYLLNITNAPLVITAHFFSTNFVALQVDCFSNVATTAALDGNVIVALNTPPATANSATSGNITTTVNGDLVYGFAVDFGSAGTSPGTGFTGIQAVISSYFSESRIQTTAGAIPATFTPATATSQYIISALGFKHL